MTKTIFFLLASVIAAPILCYFFAEPLSAEQIVYLQGASYILGAVILLSFIIAEITKNYSQTDKLWSIVPIIYVWYISYQAGLTPRLILMSSLVTVWGLRLTYNFSRRGGYSWKFWTGEEDYRWEILRSRPPFNGHSIKWSLFNFFFISFYQHVLIFLFSSPILVMTKNADQPISSLEWVLAIVMILAVIYETIADQQQWNFQTKKYELLNAGERLSEPYSKGFTHNGLWALSRHPNYLAEQVIWVVFYLLSGAATGQWLNWSIIGCILLLILFYNSSKFSEEISAQKYPEYADYQKSTPRFIPKIW